MPRQATLEDAHQALDKVTAFVEVLIHSDLCTYNTLSRDDEMALAYIILDSICRKSQDVPYATSLLHFAMKGR